MTTDQDLASRLAHADVLSGADSAEIGSFLRRARAVAIPSGTTFIHEGDADGDAAYVLISGALQIYVTGSGGREIVLDRVEPVRWVGELALLDGGTGRRSRSVRTDGPCELLRVEREDFRALVSASSVLREKLSARYEDIKQERMAKRSRLFRLLSERDDAGAGQQRRAFEAGETILAKGVRSEALHYILSGEAELVTGDGPGALSVRLGPGQCFGESAASEDAPLEATVRALSALTTLAITDAHLSRRGDESSDTRDFLASMKLAGGLPAGAQGIQYLSFLGGEEAFERHYHTRGGRKLHSSLALASKVFVLSDLDQAERGGQTRAFDWSDALLGKERHVALDAEGCVVGIRSSGDWPQLPGLVENALVGRPLAPEDFVGFEETGSIQTAHLVRHAVTDRTVCYCLGVDQDAVNAAVARGCGSPDDLRRETGCGSVCGGCLPRIREWFGGQGMMPAVARRIDRVPDIASFQFYPREGRYPAAEAGQHLAVEGLIDDCWVSRRYSITSVARASEHVEITVKREPMGVFSRWLFDGPTEAKVFRISQPAGDKTWDRAAAETVCVVAGIGVTPAIAILRTAIAEGKGAALHIDYSFTDRRAAAFVDELERAANEHPWFTCRIRETKREGRLTEAGIAALARRGAGASYHLCGPAAFVAYVENALQRSGVRAEAIKAELFVHTGRPVADESFWGARSLAYAAAVAVLLVLLPLLTWSSDDKYLAIGPVTLGHERLACADCHEAAQGTVRQQIQANVRHLLGLRAQPADFVHRPVTTYTCENCHSMQAAVHAPFMFLEPRYQPVRDSLGPHECVNCHVEHDAARVSLGDTLFCKSCHETVAMNKDPLDVPHADLAKSGQWNTCMGCHDYHGNHVFESQTRIADRFPNATVEDYFRRAQSPYGARKALATMPKGTGP